MDCPVCGRVFPSAAINAHVNACLNANEASSPRVQSQSESSDGADGMKEINATTKRKQTTNWGSLQPVRNTRQADSGTISQSPAKKTKRAETMTVGVESKAKTHVFTSAERESSLQDEPIKLLKKGSQNEISASENSNTTQSHCGQGLVAKPGSRSQTESFAPLAERVRPKDLEHYFGQDKAVGKESMLYSLLASDHIPSIILWGPPGCGKTTLARIIANNCHSRGNAKFLSLSAAVCGVSEVKDTIKIARNDQKMFRKKTIMFLDEIHRFNKTQQDVLLPHIEDGTITLIGATTENPSFQVNSALLSRCRVIVLEKLSAENIFAILMRALPQVGAIAVETEDSIPKAVADGDRLGVYIDRKALELLSNLVDGDARAALNGLQMAVEAKGSCSVYSKGKYDGAGGQERGFCSKNSGMVTMEDIKEGLQRSHVLYDRSGEEHYNIISALHKSMRGSDPSAALYWLARMLEGGENPLYIARRLIRFASEDVGLADPHALPQAVAAYQGCHLIGMPECEVLLAQCAVYLARAPKSVEMYKAYENAKACVRDHKGPLPSVPLHLRNAPTRLMKNLGYGKGYKYNPDYSEPVEQAYFPDELAGTDFFK